MRTHARKLTVCALLFTFFLPFVSHAQGDSEEFGTLNDICHVTMSRESIRAKFDSARGFIYVGSGASLEEKGTLENHTAVPLHHVRLLFRIMRTRFDHDMREQSPQIGDVVAFVTPPEEYELPPNGSAPFSMRWLVPADLTSTFLRIEVYPVQNGVHVLGDFTNTEYRGKNFGYAQVTSPAHDKSTIRYLKNGARIDGVAYNEVNNMMVLDRDEPGVVEIPVMNDGPKDVDVHVGWRTYLYGPLAPGSLLTSTTTVVHVRAHSAANARFTFPGDPAIRYIGIAELKSGGTRSLFPFRVGRAVPTVPDFDMYGVAQDVAPDATSTGPLSFTLQKGKTYHVFACLVGSLAPATTTLAFSLQDADGNTIYAHAPETRVLTAVISPFIYDFVASRDVSAMRLHMTATVDGRAVTRDWSLGVPTKSVKQEHTVPSNSNPVGHHYVLIISLALVSFGAAMTFTKRWINKKHHER